jgi:hypothetical protein
LSSWVVACKVGQGSPGEGRLRMGDTAAGGKGDRHNGRDGG